MNAPIPRNSSAGGVLVALGTIAGAIVGLILHQPTLYFLIGLAIGVVGAVTIWIVDSRR